MKKLLLLLLISSAIAEPAKPLEQSGLSPETMKILAKNREQTIKELDELAANVPKQEAVKEEPKLKEIKKEDPAKQKLLKDLAFAEANRDAYLAKRNALPKPVTDAKGHDIGPITVRDYSARWKPLEAQRNAWDVEAGRLKQQLGIK